MNVLSEIRSQLLEEIAKLEHEQWNHWMKYQNKVLGHVTDMSVDEWYKRQDEWGRWQRLAETPYSKLTEKEKESDREWARKVLVPIEKLVKADQEKHAALMAHLQNFPTDFRLRERHVILGMFKEWKEELDKRRLHPENYVCVPRKDLDERIEWLKGEHGLPHDVCCVPCLVKGQIVELQNVIASQELLQPSTTKDSIGRKDWFSVKVKADKET